MDVVVRFDIRVTYGLSALHRDGLIGCRWLPLCRVWIRAKWYCSRRAICAEMVYPCRNLVGLWSCTSVVLFNRYRQHFLLMRSSLLRSPQTLYILTIFWTIFELIRSFPGDGKLLWIAVWSYILFWRFLGDCHARSPCGGSIPRTILWPKQNVWRTTVRVMHFRMGVLSNTHLENTHGSLFFSFF